MRAGHGFFVSSLVMGGAAALMLTAAAIGSAQLPPVPREPVPPEPEGRVNQSSSLPRAAGEQLNGLFRIRKGECGTAGVTSGSYFRMITPNGGLVSNNDSSCGDKTFTPLFPGTDGGLATSGFQPHPAQAFDGAGNGVNNKITQPQPFFTVKFATATNQKDPQTQADVPQPRITHDGAGNLSGDLRSFAAAWSTQHFNQGAPKPDGTTPGLTALPTGSYKASTRSYTIQWKSHIVGGPFNNFTGHWNLEGTFDPGAVAPSQTSQTSRGTMVSGGSLAATGAPLSHALGPGLLALGAGGLAAAALADRQSRRRPRA